MSDDSPRVAFIRTPEREFKVGNRDLTIEPNAGAMDDICGGRSYHCLGFFVEPTDDQFPHLVVTDVDLYIEGELPDALDGLRLMQDLNTGDFGQLPLPWIRPGSMVGMAELIFEPPSKRENNDWDPDAGKYLEGSFLLKLDREDDGMWRVEVKAHCESESKYNDGKPDFHAVFWSALDIDDDKE